MPGFHDPSKMPLDEEGWVEKADNYIDWDKKQHILSI